MLATVLIALFVSVLVVSAFVALAFLDVVVAGPQAAREPAPTWRQWRPPLAEGNELLAWASATATAATTRRLARPRGGHTAQQLAAEIYQGSTYAMDQSPGAIGQSEPNCASCRHRMIGVTPVEALAIADAVRKTKPTRAAKRILDRAMKNAKAVAGKDHEQYEQTHVVCPILAADDSCEVFDARPLQCRGWRLFTGEDGNGRPPGEVDARQLDAHAHAVGRGAEEGLSHGLESSGLDGNVYELNSALVAALGAPTAAERWADGDPVFANCKLYG